MSITVEEKQKRLLKLLENGGSMRKAMVKAGYSQNYADNPKKLLQSKSFQNLRKQALERMEVQRQKALERMDQTVEKAKYSDVVNAVDRLTKNIQLLSGQSTSNIAVNVKTMSNEELLKLLNE